MIKNIFVAISIILSAKCYSQQLIIEVTTDKYPEETSWKLYNSDKETIKTNGTLLKNTTYRDTINLDHAQCYVWTIYDAYGDGMSNSSGPGNYALYLDNNLIASCVNPNFGDSISVYGLGSGCKPYDVSLDRLTFDATQAFNPFNLSFKIINLGSELIHSLEMQYVINNGAVQTETISFDAIGTGQMIDLALTQKLQITTAGVSDISCQIMKINDEVDENPGNNSLSKSILIKNGYWKKPMYEQFTSSTCGPCAIANKVNVVTFGQYPGQFSLIKYQVNFPGSGDPYYTPEVGYMRQGYEVNGVPSLFVDATGINAALTPDEFEMQLGQVTPVYMTINASLLGDSIFARIDVVSSRTLNDESFLRVAVVETETHQNVATNGETSFENVFMKFISAKQGTSAGYLKANEPVTLTFSQSLKNTHVEEFNDLKVVAYLFSDSEYRIIQSEMVDAIYQPAPPYFTANIIHNSTQVDTNIVIEISSDKMLVNTDGSELTQPETKVVLFEKLHPEHIVSVGCSINTEKTTFTIVPSNSLKAETQYQLILSQLASKEGVVASEYTLDFTTIEATGIIDGQGIAFHPFPNPATEHFNLLSTETGMVSIVDFSGKTVVWQKLHVGHNEIGCCHLSQGVYWVNIITTGHSISRKLVKK